MEGVGDEGEGGVVFVAGDGEVCGFEVGEDGEVAEGGGFGAEGDGHHACDEEVDLLEG